MLNVTNLHKSYQVGKQVYEVLKGVDLNIAQGEFVAVMGASGSGKSTLLNCISCYIPYEEGKITLGGTNLKALSENKLAEIRNQKMGFVFQDFLLLDGLNIRENILVPKIIQEHVIPADEKQADALIHLFRLSHIQDKYPSDVSGGERQRTAVARALINQPLIILADEPTGNLDSKSSRTVIESFKEAQSKLDATILMVTHDSYSASFCDRVVLLKDGKVYMELTKHDKQQHFHEQLLNAIQEMSEVND